jgi:hypothetical protein
MNLDNTRHSVERDIPYVCITLPVGLCSAGVALCQHWHSALTPCVILKFVLERTLWHGHCRLRAECGVTGNCTKKKKKQASTVLLLSFNVSAKETSMNYGTETLAIISLGNLLFSSLEHFNKLFEEKVNANFFFSKIRCSKTTRKTWL